MQTTYSKNLILIIWVNTYVRSDTLLLADVFENFRQSCLENYELDPAHFVFLPGLA